MRSLKKLKANGKLAVDSNAVIAYREGIPAICTIIDNIDILFLPVFENINGLEVLSNGKSKFKAAIMSTANAHQHQPCP